jgi:signal transduction histidine kinase
MFKHILNVAKCAPGKPAEAIADIQLLGGYDRDPAGPTLRHSEARVRLQERTTELREVKERLREEIEDRRNILAINTGRGLSFEREGFPEREETEQVMIHSTEDTVNAVPGAMVRISGITESENIETHLMQADRLSSLGALAAGIAYEIRDPLAAMNLFLDVLGDGKRFRPTAQALHIIEEMKRNIRKIDRLITRVTAFSEQSGATTQREVEMGALVEETVSLWRSRMTGSGIQLRLSLDEDLANILGDPVEIQQVVTNLIQNAVEAMEKGGAVSITAQNGVFPLKENCPAVIIRVQDCGRGIAPERHESVFIPFFTTKSMGTELGLAMSQRIVARHGGIIAFENVPDVGTAFWVMLPAAQRAGMPQRSFHADSAPRGAVLPVPREDLY